MRISNWISTISLSLVVHVLQSVIYISSKLHVVSPKEFACWWGKWGFYLPNCKIHLPWDIRHNFLSMLLNVLPLTHSYEYWCTSSGNCSYIILGWWIFGNSFHRYDALSNSYVAWLVDKLLFCLLGWMLVKRQRVLLVSFTSTVTSNLQQLFTRGGWFTSNAFWLISGC